MPTESPPPGAPCRVLFIVEQGGYPLFARELADAGIQSSTVRSMRKALAALRGSRPDVICAEFNFQSDFRDRVSNLDTLLAKLQSSHPDTPVIVFHDPEHRAHLARLRARFAVFDALGYPLSAEALVASLKRAVGREA